jgi:hypothetical protein
MATPANVLIGYAMRSGSTLLQHLLDQHSQIRSYSDLSSLFVLPSALAGRHANCHRVLKPLDLFYLYVRKPFYDRFDKFIWIARDPRDAYLSAEEAGPVYSYFLWLPGRRLFGIDAGLLQRWKRTYRHFLRDEKRWHLIKYEDLVQHPGKTLRRLFRYLEVPFEKVYPFKRFTLLSAGGDYKLSQTVDIHARSVGRYHDGLTPKQKSFFRHYLGKEIKHLGYSL